jgi:hypothetical protein
MILKTRTLACAAGLTVFSVGVFLWAYALRPERTRNRPSPQVFEQSLGILEANDVQSLRRSISIKNGRPHAEFVASAKTSCSCLAAEVPRAGIWNPGADFELTYVLDLNGQAGEIEQEIALFSPMRAVVARIVIRATVSGALRAQPPAVDLPDTVHETDIRITADRILPNGQPLRLLAVPTGINVSMPEGPFSGTALLTLRRSTHSAVGDLMFGWGSQALRVGLRWGTVNAGPVLVTPRVVFSDQGVRLRTFTLLVVGEDASSLQVRCPPGITHSVVDRHIVLALDSPVSVKTCRIIDVFCGSRHEQVFVW